MNEYYVELNQVLDQVRRRWQTVAALRAGARAAAVAAGLMGLALASYFIVTPSGLALVALAAFVVVAWLACAAWFIWSIRMRLDRHRLARFVEERCPELEDRLVTAVDLGDGGHNLEQSVLAAPLVADATVRLRAIDLDRIISATTVKRAGLWAAAAAVLLLTVLVIGRDPAGRAFEAAGLYAFPSRFSLEVSPGNLKIRSGQPVRIRARLSAGGGLSPTLHVGDDRPREVTMTGDGRYEFSTAFDAVTESFTYRVSAGTISSPAYKVTVVRPPRVARIDLQYEYPSSFGLAPRIEEDSGDIYAPAGTRVHVRVRSDKPIVRGSMKLTDGQALPLTSVSPEILSADLKIAEDGSYRIALADEDGLENPGDTEYFIRTLDDRPPDVRIVRPASDRQVTRLEEVTVEARADDDFGIERFELVYSVRGGPERVVPFRNAGRGLSVNGTHTLYLEELDVQPGDFVTYYARARDISRGRRATEAKSDMFFIEVKPYDEEFVSAQSQAGGASGDRSLDDLAAAQKEIIIATWKLDRRSVSGRSASDIQTVAGAQGELKNRAARSAAQFRMQDPRWRRTRPGQTSSPPAPSTAATDPMLSAVEAMGRAQVSLDGLKTAAALPHEMEALNQLLKAQADVRRRQVARQQASGMNGGGSGRPSEDLSSLFDRELQRQQQTNYETPPSAENRGEQARNDALDQIRDLAKRQDELNRQQQDLAKQRAQMTPEELKRQLERLTREQSELRRQAEELSRQMERTQAQGAKSGQSGEQSQSQDGNSDGRMRDITEEMGSAASELRREDPAQASARSGRALQKLRDLERRLQTSSPEGRRRALGDLQLEARQLADAQRQISSEVQRLGETQTARDGLRRLAGEKDRLADRVEKLGESVKQLESGAERGSDERRTIGEAAKELDRQQIDRRMRDSANALRHEAGEAVRPEAGDPKNGSTSMTGAGKTPTPSLGDADRSRTAATEQELTRALDRVAEKMASAGGDRDAESRRMSEQLSRARELRDRMSELERQMADASKASPQTAPGKGGKESGSASSTGKAGRAGEQSTGSNGGSGELGRLQEEYARQLREAQQLSSELRRDNQEGLAGSTPETWERSVSSPGTEGFKQDFSNWDVLRKDVALALERMEQSLAGQLREKEGRDRLNAGPDDQAPEEYRTLVEQYFQSLASRKKH